MTKITNYCDRCGKQIWSPSMFKIHRIIETDLLDEDRNIYDATWELCEPCLREVKKFAKTKVKKE